MWAASSCPASRRTEKQGPQESGKEEARAPRSVAFRLGYLHRTSNTRVLLRGGKNPVKIGLLLRLERCPFLFGDGFFGKGVTLNIGTSSHQSATHFLLFCLGINLTQNKPTLSPKVALFFIAKFTTFTVVLTVY